MLEDQLLTNVALPQAKEDAKAGQTAVDHPHAKDLEKNASLKGVDSY